MDEQRTALQLYTVRDETARDFTGTLRSVAALGYRAVEFAGYGDLPAAQLRDLLDETGMRAASSHVRYARLDEALDEEIAYCNAIGCSSIALPWLAPEQRDPRTIDRLADRLTTWGRRCRDRGVSLSYHNHDFEFVSTDGATLLERLLDATDPALVGLEFDIYWAVFAGADPQAVLRRYHGRVPLIHVKDMTPERRFTEVGSGVLDWRTLLTTARESGARWFIVENDQPELPSLESARRSLDYLRSLRA